MFFPLQRLPRRGWGEGRKKETSRRALGLGGQGAFIPLSPDSVAHKRPRREERGERASKKARCHYYTVILFSTRFRFYDIFGSVK